MAILKKVSLKDVAQKAGVSTALVSFVLNGQGHKYRVKEETAEYILNVAREMNYQPNIAAKKLRSGRSETIGVVVPDISNPFFAHIVRCMEDWASQRGYVAFFGSSDENTQKTQSIVSSLINRGVDGLILVPTEHSEELVSSLLKGNTPIVLLDRPIRDLNVSSVALNNFQAAYVATEHLVKNGYRNIGMIGYDIALSHMQDRLRGYRKAMDDNGLYDLINIGYFKYVNSARTVSRVIQKMFASGVEALLFGTNTISIAGMYYLIEAGIRVPDEVGVVGFDGGEAFDFFNPSVTYVRQPIEVLAQKSVDILLDAITSSNVSIQSVQVEGELVVQASSRPR